LGECEWTRRGHSVLAGEGGKLSLPKNYGFKKGRTRKKASKTGKNTRTSHKEIEGEQARKLSSGEEGRSDKRKR